jgi:hypothetical protein
MTKTQQAAASLAKANELISFLVTALDNCQRADSLPYVQGAAEFAISRANNLRERNADGYLVIR